MNNFPNITEILLNTFNTLISQFVEFVPRVIGCIVILLIGYLVARGVRIVISQLLSRVGLDRVGDKLNEIDIIKKLKTEVKLSDIVATILYYYILLIFLTFAADTLGVDTITNMVLSLVGFIPKLIAGAIMLQVGIMLSDALKTGVVSICKSFNISAAKLIGNIVFVFFLVITFITALGQIGIETALLESSFTIIFGGAIAAFGLGYGIASRDVLANIISSFYSRKNYQVGQVIKIGTVKGVISKIDTTSVTVVNETATTIIPLQMFQNTQVEVYNS
ncbi:mechanosensitive ion channel-like protein [Dyadobacter jejuensis]|uniref:Mechanosensitive ion channel-like protein n=1 Tax=Dyadobacter jejuensis TaxID=1082580 RepID=A0A316AQW5_9BACT|nr:mechanosensitive ion channel domain-containing protein [Dyadobacter jejuensis]PWJ60135.1 mechanosensitive ion channel-like protein [Dyadobacter jejuensis]